MSWDALRLDFGAMVALITGILIGGLGCYLTLKYRQVGQIRLIFVRRIRLFDTLVKNLPYLEVFYNRQNVSEELTYVEGAVVNTGTIDITKAMVHQETIVIAAGDGNKLVEFRVKAGAFDGILSPSGEKSVSMEFDLLKKDESIAFSALAEQGNQNSPLLVIDSRIAQVDVLESLNTGYVMYKTLLSNIIITFFVVAVLILLGAISSDQNPYEYLDDNGNTIEVNIIPRTDRTVDIVHVRMKYGPDGDVIIANLEETEIFRTDRISISTEIDSVMWPLYIGIVLVCLAIAYSLIEYVRGRRLRRLTARIVKAHFPDASL